MCVCVVCVCMCVCVCDFRRPRTKLTSDATSRSLFPLCACSLLPLHAYYVCVYDSRYWNYTNRRSWVCSTAATAGPKSVAFTTHYSGIALVPCSCLDVLYTWRYTYTNTHTHRHRQTDRQTDKHTHTHTHTRTRTHTYSLSLSLSQTLGESRVFIMAYQGPTRSIISSSRTI